MGWIEYPARDCICKNVNGRFVVDRKAELDRHYNFRDERKSVSVVKSAMVGSVYYAAVSVIEYDDDRKFICNSVMAAICLTKVKDGWFAYKAMDETMGPVEAKCPKNIVKLLTPTTDDYANEWRSRCLENKSDKLTRLPIGSVIRVQFNGEPIYLSKENVARWRTPHWVNWSIGIYLTPQQINKSGWEIIRA